MYGLDPRAVIAGLILGTAVALAFRGFATGHPRIARLAPWLTPLAALLPPVAVVLATWHPRGWELEGILRVGGVFYGPALVTVALVLLGASRPFARRRGAFARIAQRPLFWILAPYAVAGGLLGGLALVHPSDALAAPGNATVTKTLTAHFTAGTVPAQLTAATDQLALVNNTAPAAAAAASVAAPGAVGAGAFTLGGPNSQVFLTVRGNAGAATSYYDASVPGWSGTAGPSFPAAPGAGAFAVTRDATSYLVIRGGATNTLYIVSTAVSGNVGAWTISTPAFTLTGLASTGAHAIQRSDGRILIIHGNGLTSTSLYTPASVGTEGVVAGPAVPAAVGAGALSIPRGDGTWFTTIGGGSANAYQYSFVTPAIGSFTGTAGVTQPASAINTGAFAIQYTDGTLAGATRWLVVQGNGTAAFKYDPAGAINQAAYTAVTLTGYAPGAGGHAFKRGDGTWILVAPATTTFRVWTPATATIAATGAGFVAAAPGTGSHSFQRTDGRIVIVRGGGNTDSYAYDAGWVTQGTYVSENLNPGFVDKWDQISWTTSTANGTTVTTGVRTAAACPAAGAYTTFNANATGSSAITSASGQRCIQAEAILTRPVPQQNAATSGWARVWLGPSAIFFDRVQVASPTLSDYSLRMILGQFTITAAPTTTTAGTQISSTVTLADARGVATGTIADYNGATHYLAFSGANAAPDGSAPLFTDANGLDQPFGAMTAIVPTNGVYNPAVPNLTPFKAEVASISATEAVLAPVAGYYLCGGGTTCATDGVVQLTTAVAPTVTVNPTALNNANSTVSPNIASLVSGGTQTITVTARDNFKNPISGLAASVASAPAGPTMSAAGTTNASGVYSGTISTATLGTYTVTATVNAVALTQTLAISFVTVTGFESAPTATKDTQTRLLTNATNSNTNVAASGVQLNGNIAPSAANLVGGPPAVGNISQGAHTLLGNGGQYLVIQGGDLNASSTYDGAGTFVAGPSFTDTSGAAPLPVRVGYGGHSFKIPSGTNAGKFLLIPGGQGTDVMTSHRTLLVDPNGWIVSNGPATLSGTPFTTTSGAGAGAFSIALSDFGGTFASDPRFLIVHGGGIEFLQAGTTNTSIFDPSTNTIVAGPALTGQAGGGAFGIVRSAGNLLIFHGMNTTGSTVYTPAASPGIGTTAAGPAAPAAIGLGGHAIRYTSAGAGTCAATSAAAAPCYLIVRAGLLASNGTLKYDPALALGAAAFATGPNLSANAADGAFTIQQSNGNYLIVHGNGATSSSIFTPSPAGIAVGPTITLAVGAGAHALQQTDHRYLLFLGGGTNQTDLHDAGWSGQGTYSSEWMNPGNVDSWTSLGYTTTLGTGAVTIQTRVAQTNAGAGLITALTSATVNGAGSATLPLGSTSNRKWVRAVATLTRPVPAFTGSQTGVFLGNGYTVQIRSEAATPILNIVSFGYRSGYYRITASSPQVAGVAFASSGFALVDDTSTTVSTGVITDYTGTHTDVFSGANTAPNGTSVPTARNASAVDISFGSSTTITFANGTGATTFTLYKAETANPSASETVNGQTCPGTQACIISASLTIGTLAPAIVCNPANPNAAQSTAAVSPSTVPADDIATSTLSIVVKDAFQNPSPGLNTPRRAVTITRTGSAVIAAASGNVDAAGAYSTTIRDAVAESVTLTIQISAGADPMTTITLTTQPVIVFATITLIVTPVDSGGVAIAGPTVTAGQTFGLKIEAHVVSPSSTDVTFCNGLGSPAATCNVTFTTTAGGAPDGTTPTISGALSAVTFSAGFYTTSLSAFDLVCANGNGVSCLTQLGNQTISVQAVQIGQTPDASITLNGSTAAITVNTAQTNSRNGLAGTAVQSFVLVSPSSVGTTTAVGVPTTVSVWARVVDGFGNSAAASPSRTVTFSSTAGTFTAGVNTAVTATSASAAVYGFAGPVSLTSTTAATATISATVSDNGAAAQTATAYYFNVPRISNGTYYGTLASTNGAAPVATPIVGKGVPLAVVVTDSANKPALSVSGTTLVNTGNACWTVGAGNATGATYDAGVADAGCTTTATRTATQSGAALAGQVSISTNAGRRTYFKGAQPGAVTAHVVAGNATFDYALTVAGYFQLATTSTPNGRLVTALVDWDGTTARVIGWFAPEP